MKLGRFRSKSRPRSGRLASRSVEVGQVDKNRPTPNTNSYASKLFGSYLFDNAIFLGKNLRKKSQN